MALARLPCAGTSVHRTSSVRASAAACTPVRPSLRAVPRPSRVVLMRGVPTEEGMQSEEVRIALMVQQQQRFVKVLCVTVGQRIVCVY